MYTTSQFVANRNLRFPEEMLVRIALGLPPEIIAEEYGYTYEEIQNLPHYQVQYARVEAELFQEGAITKVIAGAALHEVVDRVANRVLDPRMPTADLLKAGDFLKKVKDEGSDKQKGAGKPQFTIEINFPDGTTTTIKEVRTIENDVPELEVDDETLPDGILDAYNEDRFGVDIDG